MGLVYVIPVGFERHVFCGLIFQMQVLKVGVSNVRFKPFTPRGEAPGFKLPPDSELPCQLCGLLQGCVLAFSTWFDVVSLLLA